jgi:hypothetical protein
MKHLLVFGALVLLFTSPVQAQNKIELFADAAGTSCELLDTDGVALKVVYAIMTGTTASTGLRFKAPKPACWTGATFVGNVSQYVSVGSSEADWSIGFGYCLQPPLVVGQINFVASGIGQPCCQMSAAPSFQFVYTTCLFGENPLIVGQKLTINPTAACRCPQPVAVEASTWGRVKSLYR